MIKVTIVLDNWISSPLPPLEFVKRYYLTDQALIDMKDIKVIQGDEELLPA